MRKPVQELSRKFGLWALRPDQTRVKRMKITSPRLRKLDLLPILLRSLNKLKNCL
jgi:hypothetical protein